MAGDMGGGWEEKGRRGLRQPEAPRSAARRDVGAWIAAGAGQSPPSTDCSFALALWAHDPAFGAGALQPDGKAEVR